MSRLYTQSLHFNGQFRKQIKMYRYGTLKKTLVLVLWNFCDIMQMEYISNYRCPLPPRQDATIDKSG